MVPSYWLNLCRFYWLRLYRFKWLNLYRREWLKYSDVIIILRSCSILSIINSSNDIDHLFICVTTVLPIAMTISYRILFPLISKLDLTPTSEGILDNFKAYCHHRVLTSQHSLISAILTPLNKSSHSLKVLIL